MDNVKVTVRTTVYNHEPYIRKCLESLVNQITDFEYEVIVHDDASTDNSVSIIREFEEKYPNIIKPIYQKENQYSKGIVIDRTFISPCCKGKYYAYCEGDDCWIDENKLQMQYDYMESNAECYMCATASEIFNLKTLKTIDYRSSDKDRDFSLEEVVLGGGELFNTCSYFIKREVEDNSPECFNLKGVSDYQITIYSAILGAVHYINKITCRYNIGVVGSWTSMQTVQSAIEYSVSAKKMIENVNEYYEYRYDKIFKRKIRLYEFNNKEYKEEFKYIIKNYKQELKNMATKRKIKVYLGAYFPLLYKLYRKLKG